MFFVKYERQKNIFFLFFFLDIQKNDYICTLN